MTVLICKTVSEYINAARSRRATSSSSGWTERQRRPSRSSGLATVPTAIPFVRNLAKRSPWKPVRLCQ